mmetsp:Transcript_26043/g.57147  ORF Transcript_26043/g.57147 Transcript_26043/m.57147 type:complete len:211 (+) Transcript_26043:1566-2198(+)
MATSDLVLIIPARRATRSFSTVHTPRGRRLPPIREGPIKVPRQQIGNSLLHRNLSLEAQESFCSVRRCKGYSRLNLVTLCRGAIIILIAAVSAGIAPTLYTSTSTSRSRSTRPWEMSLHNCCNITKSRPLATPDIYHKVGRAAILGLDSRAVLHGRHDGVDGIVNIDVVADVIGKKLPLSHRRLGPSLEEDRSRRVRNGPLGHLKQRRAR